MFGFKKRNKETQKIAQSHVINESIKNQTEIARKTYQKSEYNAQTRKTLYDSGLAKKNAKLKAFENGEAFDPYTGEKIYLTQKEAKIATGGSIGKSAEADHINPLAKFHKKVAKNPFFTDSNTKEAGNIDDNFVVISKETNTSKGDLTNTEFIERFEDSSKAKLKVEITEQGKKNLISDEQKALKSQNEKVLELTTKNVLKTTHQAGVATAVNAGTITGAMSSITNIVSVIKQEKDIDEALIDVSGDIVKAGTIGYVTGGATTTITQALSSVDTPFMKNLIAKNVPAAFVSTIIATGDIACKLMNYEISPKDAIMALGDRGINAATTGYAMGVGQAMIPIPFVGAAVGALVGSALCSSFSQEIMRKLQNEQLEHEERIRLTNLFNELTDKEDEYRNELKQFLDNELKELRDCFDFGMSTLEEGFITGDSNMMIAGANHITRNLGGKVNYETVDEYKVFLKNNDVDIL